MFRRPSSIRAALVALALPALALAQDAPPPAASAAPPVPDLAIVDYTGTAGAAQAIALGLPEPLRAYLAERPAEALFAFAYAVPVDGALLCSALVGFTGVPTDNRLPRVPSVRAWAILRGAATPGDKVDPEVANRCRLGALRAAATNLKGITPEDVAKSADKTRPDAGTYVAEKADPEQSVASFFGVPSYAQPAVHDALGAEFKRAFDHRQVETVAITLGDTLPGGIAACLTITGVVARSPQDRNARWPYYSNRVARVMKRGATVDDCRAQVSKDVASLIAEASWDANGLLMEFRRVSEDRVPLPKVPDRAAVQAQLKAIDAQRERERQQKLASWRAALKSGDDTHCGMVLRKREGLFEVQTMAGLRWFKGAQLFPTGQANCRFVNGVYQEI